MPSVVREAGKILFEACLLVFAGPLLDSMGKKPEKLKKPGHRKAERRGGIGVGALVGALLAAAAAGYYVYSSRATLVPAVRRGSVGGGGQNAASSRSAAVAGETVAQRKRRLLNEGRMDPSMQRPKCKDASFGCSGLTAERCDDEATRSKCCLSCHKLACKDTDSSCVAWAQSGAPPRPARPPPTRRQRLGGAG